MNREKKAERDGFRMANMIETPVLIAGGGPVGMTLALNLARYGVRSLLVERNPATTRHPKMDLTNARSMERSEERRVGKECVSTCRSRWSPYHSKKHERAGNNRTKEKMQ